MYRPGSYLKPLDLKRKFEKPSILDGNKTALNSDIVINLFDKKRSSIERIEDMEGPQSRSVDRTMYDMPSKFRFRHRTKSNAASPPAGVRVASPSPANA